MPEVLQHIKVFMASPSGMEWARDCVRETVADYNQSDANAAGFHLEVIGWEDVGSSRGRPQDIINGKLRLCDFFILLMHDRWGSPPSPSNSEFSAGSEEEFELALSLCSLKDAPMRDLSVFLQEVSADRRKDPGPQLAAVMAFKKRLEDEQKVFYCTFTDERRLEKLVRRQLADWRRSVQTSSNNVHVPPPNQSPGANAARGNLGSGLRSTRSQSPVDDLYRMRSLTGALERISTLAMKGSPKAKRVFAAAWQKDLAPAQEFLQHIARSSASTDHHRTAIELASVAEARGNWKEAVKHYEDALHADPTDAATAVHLAELYNTLEKYPDAERVETNALQESGDSPVTVKLHLAKGSTLCRLGRFKEAMAHLEIAGNLVEDRENMDIHAWIAERQAICAYDMGSRKDAVEYAQSAVQTAQFGGSIHLISMCLNTLGLCLMGSGQLVPAESVLQRCTHLNRVDRDTFKVAGTFCNLALLKLKQGEYDAAMEYLDQASDTAVHRPHKSLDATISVNRALVYWAAGRRDQAAESLQIAGDLFEAISMVHKCERVRRWLLALEQGEPPPTPSSLG